MAGRVSRRGGQEEVWTVPKIHSTIFRIECKMGGGESEMLRVLASQDKKRTTKGGWGASIEFIERATIAASPTAKIACMPMM